MNIIKGKAYLPGYASLFHADGNGSSGSIRSTRSERAHIQGVKFTSLFLVEQGRQLERSLLK